MQLTWSTIFDTDIEILLVYKNHELIYLLIQFLKSFLRINEQTDLRLEMVRWREQLT